METLEGETSLPPEVVRPNREAVAYELASLMSSGYVLSYGDIGEVMIKHGYSEHSIYRSANHIVEGYRFRSLVESRGPIFSSLTYRARTLYYDGSLDIETQTNMAEVKQRIDKEIEDAKRKAQARLLLT